VNGHLLGGGDSGAGAKTAAGDEGPGEAQPMGRELVEAGSAARTAHAAPRTKGGGDGERGGGGGGGGGAVRTGGRLC
jgi:hypothetical protein